MFRKSTGFVFIAMVLLGLFWGGLKAWSFIVLSGYKPVPIKPGIIDLVAVQRGAGYTIRISNATAHLVEAPVASSVDGAGAPAFDAPTEGERTDFDVKGRLPMREALKSLQGDAEALGELVMAVNKSKPDDLPPVQVVWKAEDLRKAIAGDAILVGKLEHDLNTKLDGSPLDTLNVNAILNGIVIDSPVTVKVPIEGSTKEIVCRIREPYKTLFAGSIEKMINDRFNPSADTMIGFYREKANILIKGGRKEDVASSLGSRVAPEKLQSWAQAPERILANMTVLVTENQITSATLGATTGPNRSIMYDVTLRMSEDGRMRLWKYSHENPGFQLLLTVDGVAISAPLISNELAEFEIKLTGIQSIELVEDAVNTINQLAAGKKGK